MRNREYSKNEKLSIIITCYNDNIFVEKAINSALNQTFHPAEIIVIDDGSNASTKKKLQLLKPKIDLLLTQKNSGPSSARNNGINCATGENILILDSDDYFEPTFAEKAVKVLLQKNKVKIVTCWGRRITESDDFIEIFKPGGGSISSFICENSAIGNSMFRKSDWEKVGGYDESMKQGFEDWEFYIRLLSDGGTAFVIPEVLFNYRMRKNSTTTRANKIKYDLRRLIINKHQTLYKEYHISHAQYLLKLLESQEIEKLKNLKKIEFRIGFLILRPLRWLKRIFVFD